ncbi:MAG TPA: hypothetical protein VFC58_07860 [Desulfosporosinus sp.]|nr:hypothetical protein [Desulfosporosinus sp.]
MAGAMFFMYRPGVLHGGHGGSGGGCCGGGSNSEPPRKKLPDSVHADEEDAQHKHL